MKSEMKKLISSCEVCQAQRNCYQKEPVKNHDLPDRAWQILLSDLFGYKHNN